MMRALTAHERDVLQSLADGLTRAEIAERLGVSRSAVQSSLLWARRKLGAATATQAVVIALERGLLTQARVTARQRSAHALRVRET